MFLFNKKKKEELNNDTNASKNNKQEKPKSKEELLEEKILELSDEEIEALFENGKIDQNEYEYILDFRKRAKNKKKSKQEQFEARIRCDNVIIEKVLQLGRIFRVQDLLAHSKIDEARVEASKFGLETEFEQDFQKEERQRDKKKEERTRNGGRHIDDDSGRTGRGKGREHDR